LLQLRPQGDFLLYPDCVFARDLYGSSGYIHIKAALVQKLLRLVQKERKEKEKEKRTIDLSKSQRYSLLSKKES
jgi:hypothetical protein